MAFVEWSETMSVGVTVVDDDHKVLVDLINRVADSVRAGDEQDVVGSALNTLVAYTRYHFTREERLMEACGYPQVAAHRLLHEDLAGQVSRLHRRYLEDSRSVIGAEFMAFLREWLIDHILVEDMDYRAYAIDNLDAQRAAETVPSIGEAETSMTDGTGILADVDWRRLRVLIVDENPNFRGVARTIMHSVRVADVQDVGTGEEAFERLRAFLPDVILCDRDLESMKGVEFVERLRASPSVPTSRVPVVMMTRFGSDADRDRALDAGVAGFVDKPITPGRLLESVAHAVTAAG